MASGMRPAQILAWWRMLHNTGKCRDEIQDARHVAVDLVPRPEEHGEDGIDVAAAIAERRRDQEGDRRAP